MFSDNKQLKVATSKSTNISLSKYLIASKYFFKVKNKDIQGIIASLEIICSHR